MKVLLKTYGCRANQYDTEAVRAMLSAVGGEEVFRAEDADVAVFNSCSVTAAAEADLRGDVRRAARDNSSIRTIVMGCAPGIPNRDESVAPLKTLPRVSDVIAGADIGALASSLGLESQNAAVATSAQTGARALLRIQEGCDEHCTFCATTLARGANRSRPTDEIVREAAALSESHPEIVITGIHIGSYGHDSGTSLGGLVSRLIESIPVVRFRLTSLEATEVDDELREILTADSTRIAPHLHAPLQSGSDAVLRRMGRHWYSARSYSRAVESIVGTRSVFALSADVIAGFPGETDADHAATMSLVADLPFTALHVFQYSPRPGTAALKLNDQVPQSVAAHRASELRDAGRRKSREYLERRNGGRADVVAIRRGEGLTEDYLSVSLADATIARRMRFDAVLAAGDGRLRAVPVLSRNQ
ncbi:MAG TPA: MiaB/RimO family radical SAM methylthiotransferase [Gemmatimonadaceae bacterium]|nr:MiaB/RimO family radical SAM methylthiotransferase [Gemmatimonadaceae bacterium]